jgi:hypothetical protein
VSVEAMEEAAADLRTASATQPAAIYGAVLLIGGSGCNVRHLQPIHRSASGAQAAIGDFAQAAGLRNLRSFGFDDALDLIRKVSGRATDNDFANIVTGARSLRFSWGVNLGVQF